MKPIVLIGFGRLTDEAFSTKSGFVVSCTTGNPNYPEATTYLTAVTTANDAFQLAMVKAQNGGKLETADKNRKRKVLDKAMKKLGLYVQLNCNDDVYILLTSGFDAQSDGEPRPNPGVPQNFKAVNGPVKGSIVLSVDPHDDALVYVFQYALITEGVKAPWETKIGKKSVTLEDLLLGREYAFRAAIKGTDDKLMYTEIITHYVA